MNAFLKDEASLYSAIPLTKACARALSQGLGKIMGAVTWDHPAGHDGAAEKRVDKSKEVMMIMDPGPPPSF